jgi:hypothetical protein
MMRTIALAMTVAVGMAGLPYLAEATSRCPSGFVLSQGRCYPEPGRHVPTEGYVPQSGFYREDTSRNRYTHRHLDADHQGSRRRHRTYESGRGRDPDGYGQPPLPRGQHYRIIDGQIMQMHDGYGGMGYRGDTNNDDGFQSLLNSLFR